MRTKAVCMCALLALAGCDSDLLRPPPVDIGKKLSGAEIRRGLEGNSATVEAGLNGPLTVYFPSYGEMRGLRSNNYRDTGTWSVTEDAFCGKWQNWWGTMDRCWSVYRAESRLTLKRVDGDAQDTVTWVEGNPAGL